ncbi:MAG: AsmA family protein [Alphaproteobacteria bacterium]
MKKVLIGIGAAVVLLVAAAVVAPSFIDWNAYKPEISAQVEKALGRKLAIDGDIDLSLLPSPALAVSGVRLANVQGARNPDMVRLEQLRVKVGLGELLRGRIAVDSVILRRPVIALEVLPDGRASWDFLPAAEADQPKETAPAAQPAPSSGRGIDFALRELQIEDGTVIFRDASGSEQRIEAVQAGISAGSLAGPFRVEGKARAKGVPVDLDIAVGEAGRGSGTIPVDLKLGLDGKAARLTFAGDASALAPDALVNGKLSVEAENAASALRALTGAPGTSVLAQPFRLDSEVSASADIVGLNNLTARLGDLHASGAVNAALGEMTVVDVALSATNLDLDALLAKTAVAGTASGAPAPDAPANADTPAGSPPALQAGGFALPRGMQVAVDLGAEVVRYRGGVIRDAALAGNLADGAFTVSKAGAELPGGTPLSVTGVLHAVQGQPRFEGNFTGRSSDLRNLLAWAGVEVGNVPADRLRQMQVAGKLSASPASVELASTTVTVDTTTLRAGAVVPLSGRPTIGLRVAADAVNLDAYMPKGTASAAPSAKGSAAGNGAATAATPGSSSKAASPLAALADFDANMAVSVETLTFGGERIRKLNADMQLVSGQITVRDLSVADFAGLAGKVNGSVKPLASQPTVSLDFDVTANDVARVFRFAGATPPAPADRLGRLSATGTLRGSLDSAALRGSVNALGGSVGLDGTVQNPLISPTADMAVALNHPELAKLLAAFDYRPTAAQLGPLALKMRVKTAADAVSLTDIDGSVGPVAVRGTAEAGLAGPRPIIRANLKTSDIQLDPLLPRGTSSRASLDEPAGTLFGGDGILLAQVASGGRTPWTDDKLGFDALREADAEIDMAMAGFGFGSVQVKEPVLRAVLKDGRLAIQRFAGAMNGGTVEADGQIDGAAATPALALNFVAKQIDLAKLAPAIAKFDISVQNMMQLGGTASGTGNLSGNLTASGQSTRALVQSLNGKGRLDGILNANLNEQTRGTTAALGIAGAILGQQVRELQGVTAPAQYAQKLAATFQGQNKFSGDFAIANGKLRTDNLLVDGGDGRVLTRGTADLSAWQIDMLSEIYAAGEQQPGLTIQHYGWLDAPNRRFGGSLIQRRPAATTPSAPATSGQGTTAQPQQAPQAAPVTPKDALRNLLKGLGSGG